MTVEVLPINSLSAFNYRRFLILAVAIKAYCDGSGKSDDRNSVYLTLASFIAEPDAWDVFERRWGEALARHRCEYLHMKDAKALRGNFSTWTHERVNHLLLDLKDSCLSAEAVKDYGMFVCAHCTVNLADYHSVAETYPQLLDIKPEQFCGTLVVNVAASMLPNNASRPFGKDGAVELYFDKSESFMKHVDRDWRLNRKGRHPSWNMVSSVRPSDSKSVYGIQAADFLAWNVNRYFVTGEIMYAKIALDLPNLLPSISL